MKIFGEECTNHKLPSDSFCPKCRVFRCHKCTDDHQLLSSSFFREYCYSYANQANIPSIKELQLIKEDCIGNIQKSKGTLDEITTLINSSIADCSKLKEAHMAQEDNVLKLSDNDKQTIQMLNSAAVEYISKEKKEVIINKYLPFFQELSSALTNIADITNNVKTAIAKNIPPQPKPLQSSTDTPQKDTYIVKEGGSWNQFPVERSVHYWSGSKICLIDVNSHVVNGIQFNDSTEEMDSISIGNRIFIMGKMGTTTDVYEADIPNHKLIPKAPMLCKKDQHTLCELNNFVYSIGGLTGCEPLTDCEKYSVKDDKWEQLPDLNMGRACCAAFIFNSSFIYAFAGYSESVTLERLPIDLSSKWEFVKVNCPCSKRHDIYGIQINTNEVIVFGSRYCNEDESYILKIGNDSADCEYAGKTMKPGMFAFCSPPIFDGAKVITVDNEKHVHFYDVSEKRWSMM